MYKFTRMPANGIRQFFALSPVASAPKPKTIVYSSTCKTLVRAVKLTVIIMLAGLLQVSARTTAQTRISINMRGATLEKVFSEIEKRSGYTVFYNTEVLRAAGSSLVSLDVKDATIEDVMHQCLKGLPLEFLVQDKTVFVKKEARRAVVESVSGPGSPIPSTFSGIVRNEAGTPLMGATVYVLKLKKTLVTNKDGEFTLKGVPDGEYEVIISYVGFENYRTKVLVSNHEAWLNADLKQSMSKLDETVVKGYYSTTNRLNTGDVTTVKGETIQEQPVSDPILALEGRVPGLYISQASGMPGASYTLMLQGRNSIANGINPLYIVDGVPVTSTSLTSPYVGGGAVGAPPITPTPFQGTGLSPFNALNPADIESIVVLKDADATAIYGSRGANGVILITTKKGKAGQNKVDINVYNGNGKVTRMYDLMNTKQYLAMRHEGFYNDSVGNPTAHIAPGATDYDINGTWDTTRYTNWQKTFIGGTAHFTNAQASVSGGNVNTQFVFGGGYSRQTTVFPGDYSDEKASAHFSINHASDNQKFHSAFSAQYVNDNNRLPNNDLTGEITIAPDAPALYQNGQINWAGGTWYNPVAYALKKDQSVTNNLISDLNLEYEIIPGLQIKGNFGYTHVQMNQTNETPATVFFGPALAGNRTNYFGTTNVSTWIIEPQVNYSRKISQGKLDVLIGSTAQENVLNTLGEEAYGFLNDALIPNVASAPSITMRGSNSTDYRYNAVFGRLNYSWMDKYIVNATARRDGSSRFGPGNQFGNFGAVGAAWIFSKEKLFQNNLPFVSFGKIRGSYGATGNDQITDYQYLSTYTTASSAYQGLTGLYPTSLANPYFGWEMVKKLEGGIELGFLKDRILLNGSYYRNRTNNQLVGYTLPSIDGFTTVQANLPAVVQNTGAEIELNTTNIRSKNFTWSTSVNLTIPRNKLVAYPGLASSSYRTTYEIGQSLFIKRYYHYTGVNPQTGVYTFADINHDGQITSADEEFSKSITQNYYGGILNTFSYKGLQLDVFFQFVKQTGINYLATLNVPGGINNNMPTYVLSRWHYQGELTGVEQFTSGYNVNAINAWSDMNNSDYLISDASFIRLKNLALSYTFPKEWQRKARLQNARIYLQCQNLFTITKYKGLDPETQGLSLPPLSMITAGFQVSL